MTSDVAVTDLLGRLARGEEDAYTDLFEYYFQAARRYASSRISRSLQSSVSATSVAATALRQCLDQTRTSGRLFANRDEFQNALFGIVRCRTIDAVRKEKTLKRGRDRRKEPVRNTTPGPQKIDASVEAMLNELAIRKVHNILQEPTETRREICLLGILCQFSGAKIQEAIMPLFDPDSGRDSDNNKLPSVRLIQEIVAERKKKILEELGSET